jgi:prophage regulatory protein
VGGAPQKSVVFRHLHRLPESDMPKEFNVLRRPEVENVTGLRRSSIYEEMAAGRFPLPIKIGRRAVGWIEGEIIAWKERRLAERDRTLRAQNGGIRTVRRGCRGRINR